jgi:hypothetical protein
LGAERLSLGLREMTSKWIEAIGGDSLKGDAVDREAAPLEERGVSGLR